MSLGLVKRNSVGGSRLPPWLQQLIDPIRMHSKSKASKSTRTKPSSPISSDSTSRNSTKSRSITSGSSSKSKTSASHSSSNKSSKPSAAEKQVNKKTIQILSHQLRQLGLMNLCVCACFVCLYVCACVCVCVQKCFCVCVVIFRAVMNSELVPATVHNVFLYACVYVSAHLRLPRRDHLANALQTRFFLRRVMFYNMHLYCVHAF